MSYNKYKYDKYNGDLIRSYAYRIYKSDIKLTIEFYENERKYNCSFAQNNSGNYIIISNEIRCENPINIIKISKETGNDIYRCLSKKLNIEYDNIYDLIEKCKIKNDDNIKYWQIKL